MSPSIAWVHALSGLILLVSAFFCLQRKHNPKRFGNAAFFALSGIAVLAADGLSDALLGALVIAIGLLGAARVMQSGVAGPDPEQRQQRAQQHRDRVFIPALLIPALTIAGVLLLKPHLPKEQAPLFALALACALALAAALVLLRARLREAFDAASHLLETISWPVLLPLLLAILGGVFAQTGVGEVIAHHAQSVIPVQSKLACVIAYAFGMALFTMVMGNAFAAFPVMTAGIGVPFLVKLHGADPAILGAIGMLSGYCGTLMTPMAANFNLVPAALLELKDQHAVIRAQIPTALPLLLCNVILMMVLLFP